MMRWRGRLTFGRLGSLSSSSVQNGRMGLGLSARLRNLRAKLRMDADANVLTPVIIKTY